MTGPCDPRRYFGMRQSETRKRGVRPKLARCCGSCGVSSTGAYESDDRADPAATIVGMVRLTDLHHTLPADYDANAFGRGRRTAVDQPPVREPVSWVCWGHRPPS